MVKNYVLNLPKKVTVGEAVVVHKDYIVSKVTGNMLMASNDFYIDGREFGSIKGKKNDTVPLEGTIVEEGQEYYLIPLQQKPNSLSCSLMINRDGYYAKRMVMHFPGKLEVVIVKGWDAITPQDTRFTITEGEAVVDTTAGFTNFELIYTGKNSQSITFMYREYTPQDMIRAAYTQNLIYDVNSKSIRFRKIKIKVLYVTDDGIEYEVVED